MNSPRTPSWIQRLRAEIRSACGTVDASRSASVSPARPAASSHPIGEWLGSVRQPTEGFPSMARGGRRALSDEFSSERGDMMRTRVTRIKGERATLRF